MPADGKLFIKRYEDLKIRRITRAASWDFARTFLMPQKFDPQDTASHDGTKERTLYDQTAIDANETLANGHMSHITPIGTRWFQWEPPEGMEKFPEVKRWYADASFKAWKYLSGTNFYAVSRETYLERSGFGIGAKMCFESKRNGVFFKNMEAGSYVIEENAEGEVDTFMMEERWGIRQLVAEFGEEALTKKMREAFKKFSQNGKNVEFDILWVVMPREDYDHRKADSKSMPVMSAYLCLKEGEIIRESGFMEFPGSVSRYLKGGGDGKEYGYGPVWRALPSIKGANFMQMIMDYLGEKAAVPPVLIPDYLEGLVDMRPGGATSFQEGKGMPQEWTTKGNYNIGEDRVEKRQAEINRAFHVDLFRFMEEMDKTMTLGEFRSREAEKLEQFGPTFIQQMYDDRNIMRRLFGMLLRNGTFGRLDEIPRRALIQTAGVWMVPDPKMVYLSKMALALNYVETSSLERSIERRLTLATIRPDVFDTINLDKALRLIDHNEGVPNSVMFTEEETDQLRAAQAAQQQQAQQMEQMEQMAGAAGKVGVKV